MKKSKSKGGSVFESFASKITHAVGTTTAFILAGSSIILWLVCGPVFNFSDTWQLVINTGTTIITFLMVFLIQKTQNKDSIAIQIKLNELVAASSHASNRLVNVEGMTEDEMRILGKYYEKLALMAKKDESLQTSHSIEEAHKDHLDKRKTTRQGKKKSA
jgi:low affinity Fe/Cu permease